MTDEHGHRRGVSRRDLLPKYDRGCLGCILPSGLRNSCGIRRSGCWRLSDRPAYEPLCRPPLPDRARRTRRIARRCDPGFADSTDLPRGTAKAFDRCLHSYSESPLRHPARLGKLAKVDFRKITYKEVADTVSAENESIRVSNIMNAIDKLEKRVSGTRLTYEVLCEFLHPNRGDLFGSTVSAQARADYHGTRHLDRTISLGPKTLVGSPDVQAIIEKMMDVSVDILRSFPAVMHEIEAISGYATKITQEFAHNVATKHYKHLFTNRDPCPCLSGLRVRDCAGRRAA